MKKILVLHGPNLNQLGSREPQIYGQTSLAELNKNLITKAKDHGFLLSCKQSNSESELIGFIQQADDDYIIFNPAAFTHTSIALRDAIQNANIPFIEIHISNVFSRESFRQHSYFTDIAQGLICGLGVKGYFLALQAIIDELK